MEERKEVKGTLRHHETTTTEHSWLSMVNLVMPGVLCIIWCYCVWFLFGVFVCCLVFVCFVVLLCIVLFVLLSDVGLCLFLLSCFCVCLLLCVLCVCSGFFPGWA